MRTSAAEVSIQAVSPVSIFGSADQARVARLSTTPAEIITPVIFFGTATFLLVARLGLPPVARKGRGDQPGCQGAPLPLLRKSMKKFRRRPENSPPYGHLLT